MAKPKLTTLQQRIITSLILIPLTVCVLFLGLPYVKLFVLMAGAMLCWEWVKMVPSKKPETYAVAYTLATTFVVLSSMIETMLVVMLFAMMFVWYKARKESKKAFLVWGIPYIIIGMNSLIWMYLFFGMFHVLWLLIVVWGVDVGGYLVGSNLKGPKLAPKISPNKTWSGLFGGVILAGTLSVLFDRLVVGNFNAASLMFAMGAMIATIAQIGDLLESFIKRRLKLKDSSDLIPGHGGVFDRIDGLIFAAPFALAMFHFIWVR